MKSFLGLIMLIGLSMSSCRKGEGKGGKATITGKVYVDYYNQSGSSIDKSYYARDKDVFIVSLLLYKLVEQSLILGVRSYYSISFDMFTLVFFFSYFRSEISACFFFHSN